MPRYNVILYLPLLLTFTTANCLLTREKLVTISEHVVEHLQGDVNSENTTEELKAAMARPQVTLKQVLQKFPFLLRIADRLARIEENVWYIEHAYNYQSQFLKKIDDYEPFEAKYLAKAFLDIGSSVNKIFKEAVEEKPKKPSVFSVLASNLNPRKKCVSEKSSKLMVDSLFNIVCYAEVHAFMVEWNSIKILRQLREDVSIDKDKLINDFKTRLLQLWEKANASIENVTGTENKCKEEEEEREDYNYEEDIDDVNKNSTVKR